MAGPWEKYGAAPERAPGVIQGRPKQPSPIEVERLDLSRDANARADRAEERADRAEQRTIEKDQRGTVEQGKAASFLRRAINAETNYSSLGVVQPRSLPGQAFSEAFPNAANTMADGTRQRADQAEREFIAAILRYDSGAAIPPEEFVTNGQIYFPRPGDTPETIAQKAQARRVAIEGLMPAAGPAGAGMTLPDLNEDGLSGVIVTDDSEDEGLTGGVTYEGPNDYNREIAARADKIEQRDGKSGYSDIAKQGVTLGLSDEASGIGTAIGRALTGDFNLGDNYRKGRDTERELIDRARDRTGWAGTGLEILAGGGGVRNLVGKTGNIVREGIGLGALGGYGYGEGAQGSATNALAGAALGGAVGLAGQKVGNALVSRQQRAVDPARAQAIADAGQAEGVTVNRAMVDPNSNNAVTKADAGLIGGRRVQREMAEIEGQMEGRVADLGQGGSAMNPTVGGQTVERAGARFIEQTGKAAKVKYDRAEKMAGNARIEPKQSLKAVDDMIATLSETPGQNSAEIAFLTTLKDDLSKNLSVGALRRMRTSLRKRIRNGGLTFGEDEARVLGIMDAASDDIRVGLTAQGNPKAASAFDAADKAYRARMEYISGTLQKIMGQRNANLPAERMWQRFEAMASNKGDAVGLRRFYASLTADERADVAATFADDLGRNNAGEFSVAHFLSQTEKLSDTAIKTIFGPDGAQSVSNLRTIGREVKRVTGAMNSRTSKSGVANFRDWLWSALATGGTGLTGNLTQAAAVGGAVAGATAVNQMVSARLLMSPRIQKWLLNTPKTTSPQAIDAHFSRLQAIARTEPALAGEIEVLQQGIMRAANDNVARPLAASGDERQPEAQ